MRQQEKGKRTKMTREDTIDLMTKIFTLYPNWKLPDGVDIEKAIDTWYEFLKDTEKEHATRALNEYVTVERNTYAPSVSDLYNLAKKYKPDPRFEGMEYWERRIHSIYPYKSNWDHKLFCEWYTDDRECQQLYRYLTQGIDSIERKLCPESVIDTLEKLINKYEDDKKCLTMKKV